MMVRPGSCEMLTGLEGLLVGGREMLGISRNVR